LELVAAHFRSIAENNIVFSIEIVARRSTGNVDDIGNRASVKSKSVGFKNGICSSVTADQLLLMVRAQSICVTPWVHPHLAIGVHVSLNDNVCGSGIGIKRLSLDF